jgi:hypothetical protein
MIVAVRTDASDPCSANEQSVPTFFSNVEGGRDAFAHAALNEREQRLHFGERWLLTIRVRGQASLARYLKWRNSMTNFKVLSTALIAVAVIVSPAIARETHVASRHFAAAKATAPAGPVYIEGRACIPAPRVGAFATAPWTGDNIPCEPGPY